MATKKAPASKAPAKKPAKAAAKAAPAAKAAADIKPVKESFTKAALAAHLAQQTEVELKTVKKVLAALEAYPDDWLLAGEVEELLLASTSP